MKIGAGIIVFKRVNNHPQFLGLIAIEKERKRVKGMYDVPKGHVDEGEDLITAAKRECFEESGLTPKILSGPFKIDNQNFNLYLWLGEVDENDEVVIVNNPTTGLIEHEGYEWVSPEKMRKNCLNYLKPHLNWATKEVWNYFKI